LQDDGDEASKEPDALIALEEEAAGGLPDGSHDQHEANDVDDDDLDLGAAQKDAAAHEENRTPGFGVQRPQHEYGR
jgi:hypothetical protein